MFRVVIAPHHPAESVVVGCGLPAPEMPDPAPPDGPEGEFHAAFRRLTQFIAIGGGHGHTVAFGPGHWKPRAAYPSTHEYEAPIGERVLGEYHLARERLRLAQIRRRIKTAGRRPAFDPAARPWNGRSFAS